MQAKKNCPAPGRARGLAAVALRALSAAGVAGLLMAGLGLGCGGDAASTPNSAPPVASNGIAKVMEHGTAPTVAPGGDQNPAPTAPPAPVAPAAPASGPITAGTADLTPIADTSIACFPDGVRNAKAKDSEQSFNYGKSTRLKIKRQENVALLKFDFAKVPAGATITKAEMIVTMDNAKSFNHMGVYSLHVDWNEGEGNGDGETTDKPQTDADTGACFLGPKGLKSKWRNYADSDFSHAAAGNGGNATWVTRAKDLGNAKWQIDIDPQVVEAAIVDGQTLCLNEETGAWSDKYSNGYICSREAGEGKAPVLKLTWSGERDAQKPVFDGVLSAETGPWPGSVILNLPKAYDDGLPKAGEAAVPAVGYRVEIEGRALPTVEVPRPSRFHREMFVTGLTPGKEVAVIVTAFDEAGNIASLTRLITTGAAWTQKLSPIDEIASLPDNHVFPGYTVRVVDGLTLFDPLTGDLSPKQTRAAYKPTGDQRYMHAVRGDIVGFQVLITKDEKTETVGGVKLRLSDFVRKPQGGDPLPALGANGAAVGGDRITGAGAIFQREHFVPVKEGEADVWIADPLPQMAADEAVAIPSQKGLPGQKMAAVYVDLHVPVAAREGVYQGNLIVSPGGAAADVSIPLTIDVADVALPDELSFVVEMNAYGHPAKDKFWAMYRLFHAHRLSFNALSYGHTNGPDPKVLPLAGAGKTLHVADWSAYDELYGPLFTGEVAKGLPRDGAPATHWYLPFHEGWPEVLEKTDPNKLCWEGRVAPHEDKDKYEAWLDQCLVNDPLVADHFSQEWRDGNAAVVKQFAEHAKEKGWTKTSLQVFSNHKMYFDAGSMSLWVMDEPQYGRDYRALNWFMAFYSNLFKDSGLNIALRADISRPGWIGDRLDEGFGTVCTSSGLELERELNSRRKIATGKTLWWYGGAGDASTDPLAMSALFIRKWSVGCDGGLPNWTAVGGPGKWDATGPLRYITSDPDTGMPVATFRMKACREGQELIELLNQLARKPGFNRWIVADLVNKQFEVKIVTKSKNVDDPGISTFEGLDYTGYEKLREQVVETIHPAMRSNP